MRGISSNTLVMYFVVLACLFSCRSFIRLSKANLRANCLLMYLIILLDCVENRSYRCKNSLKSLKKNESFCADGSIFIKSCFVLKIAVIRFSFPLTSRQLS